MQTTSRILMIRPVNFIFNAETAVNNTFQVAGSPETVHEKALHEFDQFVDLLEREGVDVMVVPDTPSPHTPDSIFPNNWISFHDDGTICLYPMFANNRRLERKPAVLEAIGKKFIVSDKIDLSGFENHDLFLEGTGSMVLDRDEKIVYACLSPRTNIKVLEKFCSMMRYRPVVFNAVDHDGNPIYHTNVMMCVADKFVIAALDTIPDERERTHLLQVIGTTGKEVIPISREQVNEFAGNMLMVHSKTGEKLLVMSSRAYASLLPQQITSITRFCRIIHSPLNTIETNGGGSARCMMAEIHLPVRY